MSYILEQYDDLLREVLKNGRLKKNRTGVDTYRLVGQSRTYDVSQFAPMVTKRKLSLNAIVAELRWYLHGKTNAIELKEKYGSSVWMPWVSPEFEQKNRLVEGDLGFLYGAEAIDFNGQHYGGQEKTRPYIGQCNQVDRMINLIKTDPDRRDILLSVWNPLRLEKIRLRTCHFAFQVLANEDDKTLDGIFYMRSSDLVCGTPFNLMFYYIFLYILGLECGYKPNTLTHVAGDAHIYKTHVEQLENYLSRPNVESPTLNIKRKAKDVYSYENSDFELLNYNPHPFIKFPVAV